LRSKGPEDAATACHAAAAAAAAGVCPVADPLKGALINPGNGNISSFIVKPSKGYPYPTGVSACMTNFNGQPLYMQHGGHHFDDGVANEVVYKGFDAVRFQLGQAEQTMVGLSGGSEIPAAAYASLACSPDGKLYTFGGLAIANYTELLDDAGNVVALMPVWQPQRLLFTAKLAGSSSAPSVSRATRLAAGAKAAATPGPRSGHALTYLPSGTVLQLGVQSDALLLYGGSDVRTITLGSDLDNEAAAAELLNSSNWDTAAWLYDIAADKWMKLAPVGDLPPGLMYHSMAVEGKQVRPATSSKSPTQYLAQFSADISTVLVLMYLLLLLVCSRQQPVILLVCIVLCQRSLYPRYWLLHFHDR
jgi:hypothetical protein